MSRSIALTTILALGFFAPRAHAQSPDAPSLEGAQLAAFTESVDADEGSTGNAYVEDDTEEDYAEEDFAEDMEYCGGGEMSIVDEAWDEMEFGDRRRAYEQLVDALRHGEVESYERGRALSILAELQLRRGEPGRAIVNFRRAEHIEEGVTEVSRVALATALFRRGERRLAQAEARAAHEQLCSDQYAVAGCFTANLILARTERSANERLTAANAATTLRQANPDLARTFDDAEARVAGS